MSNIYYFLNFINVVVCVVAACVFIIKAVREKDENTGQLYVILAILMILVMKMD